MNPELKRDWLIALRGGQYKQGRNYLRRADNSCCCLGVLGDLFVKRGKAKWISTFRAFYPIGVYSLNGHTGLLDLKHAEQAGLTEVDSSDLMRMNDSGDSFATIANWIEKNL